MMRQALGREACIIIPQSDGVNTMALRVAQIWLEDEFTSRFGGFTRTEGEGVGQEKGDAKKEPVYVYTVAGDGDFLYLAEQAARMSKQETIYVRLPDGMAYLVGANNERMHTL